MYAKHEVGWPVLSRLIERLPQQQAAVRGKLIGYVLALALVGLAWLSRVWVGPADVGLPLLTFYSAAALATLLLGIGPGLMAAVLGSILGTYFYMPPYGEFSFAFAPGNVASNVIFFIDEVLLCLAVLAMRRHFEQNQANRELLSAIVEGSSDAIQVIDTKGRYRFVNTAAARRAGKSASQMLGHTPAELALPAEPLVSADNIEFSYRGADDDERIYLTTRGPLHDAAGRYVGLFTIDRDITGLRRRDEQLRLAARVFDTTIEGLMVTDAQRRIITVNASFTQLTGYTREELIGQRPSLLHSGRHDAQFHQAMHRALAEHGHWEGEVWDRHKDGHIFLIWLAIDAVRDEQGQLSHHIGTFRDITVTRNAHARMTWLATHDELTGLPNRTLLHDRLQQALVRAEHASQRLAVLLIDIDNFKLINDSHGHEMGDALLLQAAGRLQGALRECCLRQDDLLVRMGGDEFAVVLENIDQAQVSATAECIVSQLSRPYQLGSQECYITVSVGISLYPDNAITPTSLLSHADTAMYRVKDSGKSHYQYFTKDMAERTRQRLDLEHGLRRALLNREFHLEYQPQVDLHSQQLVGVEALLRWRHGERNISPLEFIPIAEETHLIDSIGEWVVTEACRQIHAWDREGLPAFTVSVNISARHFLQADMVTRLHDIVSAAGIAPQRLCIEVTEGAMSDVDQALGMLTELTALGFATSVDDFGTGFSSLSHLKRFPLHELKIDRSFVNGIVDDCNDHAITSAIIAMAGKLDLRVIAEGIETTAQLQELRALGCSIGQGYLFSRPLPGAQLLPWLSAQTPLPA